MWRTNHKDPLFYLFNDECCEEFGAHHCHDVGVFQRRESLSWAKAKETQERESARARRTDNRDLGMGDPFKQTLGLQFCVHSSFEGLEVQPYSTDCRVKLGET